MFIAGTYMLYSPPVTTQYSGPASLMSAALDRASAVKKCSFRMADLLDRDHLPRKAACLVVARTAANNDAISLTKGHSVNQQLPSPSVESRTLKFGMDRILSDEITSRKASSSPSEPPSPSPSHESPSPASYGASSTWTSCVSRCCPLPSCRCNGSQILEPYPIYPYSALSIIGQPLVSYPSSIYSQSMDARHHQLVGHHPPTHGTSGGGGGGGKRKRSWSRAVFSNLQRKGLEKRFQIQKYITKPDRRQLAATLGLTDAQVKVWFQNRRMKWRHSKEAREQFRAEKKTESASSPSTATASTTISDTQTFQQTHVVQQQCTEIKPLSSVESERTNTA